MMRPWLLWSGFTACLVIVFGGLGWVCVTALELDRAETEARRKADFEEGVRLALWRMESAVTPLVTQESARPYFAFSAFYAPERAYTRMFEEIAPQDVLVPSPLLKLDIQEILVHFQIDPELVWSSPQIPTSNMRDLAESRGFTTLERIERAASHLRDLQMSIDRNELMARLSGPDAANGMAPIPMEVVPFENNWNVLPLPPAPVGSDHCGSEEQGHWQAPRGNYKEQLLRNDTEWLARNSMGCSAEINRATQGLQPGFLEDVTEGPMQPQWIDGRLVMARRVAVRGREYVQGYLLDWARVRTALLETSRDLLPESELVPVAGSRLARKDRMLAALPIELEPGDVPFEHFGSEVRFSIAVVWGCVLMASVAVALLLVGTLSMSERRRRFVSAVTHELRTPLTTFRMYTEMLENGMVRGEDKRQEYLTKLASEADRLGHLVENVLAYARLEGSRQGKPNEALDVVDFLDHVSSRLAERAALARLELRVETVPSPEGLSALGDPGAVERILFNLVDNACKYARPSEPAAIDICARRVDQTIQIEVRDHGPGIPLARISSLFRPFGTGSYESTSQEPGVGLGLSLSRRLARQMGADLELTEAADGACFVLTLPVS